ncbi:hypothetical protein [Chryseobacterium sp.]|uniref:hypothetical protein n=1 Tax=Chryseobacterium sp. TaxID=1871047 RepID=UPI003219673E
MKKIVLFLVFAFTLQSCKKEKQRSVESQSPEIQEVQQDINSVNPSSQSIEGKKDPNDFIPEGYVINKYEGGVSAEGWNEIKGDLNKDGLKDLVLIIKATDKSKIIQDENRGELDRNRRGIIVLLNKGSYYELASKNYNCFSSENEDGGVYFAPELSVSIEKGNLHIDYGHGRYGSWGYTFRYQNGDMELIGYDSYSSRGPVPQYEVSINFLTKKKLTKDNLNKEDDGDNYEVKYKDTWETIKVNKLIKLSEIKDFDELEFN